MGEEVLLCAGSMIIRSIAALLSIQLRTALSQLELRRYHFAIGFRYF